MANGLDEHGEKVSPAVAAEPHIVDSAAAADLVQKNALIKLECKEADLALEERVEIFEGATPFNIGLPGGIKRALSTPNEPLENGDVVEVLRQDEKGCEHVAFYTVGKGREVQHEGSKPTYHTVAGGTHDRNDFVGKQLIVRRVPKKRLLDGVPMPVEIVGTGKYISGPSWMAGKLGLPLCPGKVNTFEKGRIKLRIGNFEQEVIFVPKGGSIGITNELAAAANLPREFTQATCIIEKGKLTI